MSETRQDWRDYVHRRGIVITVLPLPVRRTQDARRKLQVMNLCIDYPYIADTGLVGEYRVASQDGSRPFLPSLQEVSTHWHVGSAQQRTQTTG